MLVSLCLGYSEPYLSLNQFRLFYYLYHSTVAWILRSRVCLVSVLSCDLLCHESKQKWSLEYSFMEC